MDSGRSEAMLCDLILDKIHKSFPELYEDARNNANTDETQMV